MRAISSWNEDFFFLSCSKLLRKALIHYLSFGIWCWIWWLILFHITRWLDIYSEFEEEWDFSTLFTQLTVVRIHQNYDSFIILVLLAVCNSLSGRLETCSRLFFDFIKMTIQKDLAIFNGWYIPFLIVLYSPFQKNKTLESWHIWLLSNWVRLLNWKGPRI